MEKWSKAQSGYIASLKAAGRAKGTLKLHDYYLGVLSREVRSPWSVTQEDLIRVLGNDAWGPETRKSARGVYRGFFAWAFLTGHIDCDPAALLPSVKVPSGRARPTPEPVYKRSILSADKRLRLMVKLGGMGGLRACEIATVHSSALEGNLLRVTGKGGKVRLVPIFDDELLLAIKEAHGWLFPGRIDGHLSAGYVTKLLSNHLPEHWTAHTLRHRAGTRAYEGTRDILAVAEFLGHSTPTTTQRYIRMPLDSLMEAARAAA